MGQQLWMQYGASSKMKNTFSTWSSHATLGVYPKELKIGFKDIFVHLCSLAALFTIAESWGNPDVHPWRNGLTQCGCTYSGILFSLKQIGNFFFTYIFKIYFSRRMIALHCCVAFCHTPTWISHRYAYVPSLLTLPPIPLLHPTLLGCHRAPGWAPCITQQIPTGDLFYIW